MGKIQMVDLLGQYKHIQEEIDRAVLEVIRSSAYIGGPEVKAFQSELEAYLNVKHVIPCGNGTDALQIAMMALGLKPGDEVIAPNFTFVATVEVIALLGLKPILVDVDPRTFNIDLESARKAVTPRTKAIVPVHLFGQCADMEPLLAFAEEYDLKVVEDSAQAISSTYTFSDGHQAKAGTMGDFGTTSFFPSKNLGCYGDGGALYTNNDDLADMAREVANHGMKVRYYHSSVGVNSRLDSIQAAILRIKLRHLDTYCDARIAAADAYDAVFADTPALLTPLRVANSTHTFHQYTLITRGVDRDVVRQALMDQGIPAMVYYPVPLHAQEAYRSERYSDADFPVTMALSHSVMSLPMHTELTSDQIAHITDSVLTQLHQPA